MSDRADLSSPPERTFFFRALALTAATLVIALLLFRVPETPGGDRHPSYRMLLDLSFRPAAPAAMPVHTLDGPLAPLQNPVYTGRSIWRAMSWQIGANLLMAGIVAAGAFRLPSTRAWWALILFVVFGISDASIAPWITLLVLGRLADHSAQRTLRVLSGVGLGVFASISIAHFLLGAGAVVLSALRTTESRRRDPYPAAGFVAGVCGTWLLLDQSLFKLGRWLWFGLTDAWTPSSIVLSSATTRAFGWAALAMVAWMAAVLFYRKALRAHKPEWHHVLLVTWGMFLAWKLVAVQPAGTPLLFFATVIFGGFLLLPKAPRFAAIAFIIGVVGAAVPDKLLVTDAVGRINRQLLRNVNELRTLPQLRDRLRQDFSGYGASFAMPLTRAKLAGASVGVLGDQSMQAILNDFRVTPSPSFGTQFVSDDRVARKNAEAILAPDAPPFLLERSDRDSDLLPGLRDGPAHLAMYRAYDFVLNEQNLSLWKKRAEPVRDTPKLIKEGTLQFGEKLTLSPSDEAFWVELDCTPNWIGLALDQFKPLAEPFLRVVDDRGDQLRYTLAWRMARAGFLAHPFFRGDMDVLQFEEGQKPRHLSHLVVDPPESTRWSWRATIRYRLYQFPQLVTARVVNVTAPFKNQFAALNRLPSSVYAPFAPLFGSVMAKPAVFMHPNSVFEMIVTADDRTIQGTLGIAPGAYANSGPNVTDGVSFSIEFIPASGARTLLFRRDLDPAATLDDRGPQPFTVSLPSSPGGRLLFRTFNLPDKSSSFDWSYWREIELK